ATITGTKTIRDNVICIGNDFFQSLMMAPLTDLLSFRFHCCPQLPGFARYFWVVGLVFGLLFIPFKISAQGARIQDLKPPEFSSLRQDLEAEMFWHKPQVWKQMIEARKIPVSVLRRESRWSFKGAGIVERPRSYCFEKAKDFDRLRKIPEYFKDVSYEPATSILSLKIQFLGRRRNMRLKLSEEVLKSESRMYFRAEGGWLSGLEGALMLKDQGRHGTEIGIFALYPGKVAWVPDWLFAVAAEGVMHHVAETLRKSLETDYKN
ncbi:MAG: hypothetical protein ACXWC9_07640, partial [Pseudobdellovibrionaceae bacterium]